MTVAARNAAGAVRLRSLALAMLSMFVFSIPWENAVTIAGAASLSRIVGGLAFVAAVMALYDEGRLRLRMPSLFIVVAASFVLWNAGTYFWSVAPVATVVEGARYAQLLVLAWLVHELGRGRRQRDVLMQAYVLGCYLLVALAVFSYLASPDPGFRDLGRFNANEFAIVAALGIPMAWALQLRHRHGPLDALNAIYPAIAILAVVLGASRGGLITALVALTVIPLTLNHLRPWRRVVLFLALVALAWGAFETVPRAFPELQANVERLAGTSQELRTGDLTGRVNIWRAGLDVFTASPAVGVGAGGFRNAVEPILGRAYAPHNGFLSVAVGSGLVGFVLFGAMLGLILVTAANSGPRRLVYLVLFATLMIALMPANAENAKYTWFALAIMAAARPLVLSTGGRARGN